MNISDFLLNAMRIWAWPISVFSVLFLFRHPIGELISRLHSVTSKMGNVTFTQLQKIQQNLPSPKLEADLKVKDVRQSLDLSACAVETIIPAPLNDCREEVSDEKLPLMMENSWQDLIRVLKKSILCEAKDKLKIIDKLKTVEGLLKVLKSSRPLAPVVKSVTELANIRERLQTGADPIDAATVTAFMETVEKIIFTIRDKRL